MSDDLDSLLDSALDEYTTLSSEPVVAAPPSSSSAASSTAAAPPNVNIDAAGADIDALAHEFLATFGISVSLTSIVGSPSCSVQRMGGAEGVEAQEISSLLRDSAPVDDALSAADLAARLRHIADTSREATAAAAASSSGAIPGLSGEADEAMLERVLQQLDEEPGMQGAMQELVQQIMAKDVLYEPMIELRDKYPLWLVANQLSLSTDDRLRYTRQHELIAQICAEYERSAVNYERLTDLMAAVQELGQPPREIVSQLAPDMPLDAQGQPQLGAENCTIQ